MTYTCACGDSYTADIEDGNVDLTFTHSVTFGADYKLLFRIRTNKFTEATTDKWMEVTTYTYVDGVAVPETHIIEAVLNGNYYDFVSPGIPAKNMNDRMTWVFYEIIDGYKYHHTAEEYNLVSYYNDAKTSYENTGKASTGLIVDLLKEMFNYGATAQNYFEYNTEVIDGDSHSGLVNLHIPEADRKTTVEDFATTPYGQERIEGDEAGMVYELYNNVGEFKQQITLSNQYKFTKANELDMSTLVFKGSYTNAVGEYKEIEIPGTEFVYSNTNKTRIKVNISTIAAKDLRCLITGAIYDANGNQVSETVSTSMECYVTLGMASTSAMKPLLIATLAYSDAAAYYFQNK